MRLKTLLTASFAFFLLTTFAQTGQSKDSTEKRIFDKVESEASFPGGNAAWAKYLQKALGKFNPSEHGAPVGRYQVITRFIVAKDGSTSEVQAETRFGFGMEEKVIVALEKSGKWEPAMQNGRPVNAYRRQPVTFIVEEDGFEIITETPYTLYTNVPNHITVKASGVKPENIGINVTGGKVTANNYDGTFTIVPVKVGRVVIEVVNTKKNDKVIGTASIAAITSQ